MSASETVEGVLEDPRDAPLVVQEERPSALARPLVTPDQAREAMRQYVELCEAVGTEDDLQDFEQRRRQRNPETNKWETVTETKKFKKKSFVKKLQKFFGLSVDVLEHTRDDLGLGHFGFRVVARAIDRSGNHADALGGCSTYEERFDLKPYSNETEDEYAGRQKKALARAYHDIISTAETRATNRAVMNCIGVGGGEVTADEVSKDRSRPPKPHRFQQPAQPRPVAKVIDPESVEYKWLEERLALLSPEQAMEVIHHGTLGATTVLAEIPGPKAKNVARAVVHKLRDLGLASGSEEPPSNEEERDRARKALMALVSEHGIPDKHRYKVSMMLHGLESTKQLDAQEMRALRAMLERYVDDGILGARDEVFEAWLSDQFLKEEAQ